MYVISGHYRPLSCPIHQVESHPIPCMMSSTVLDRGLRGETSHPTVTHNKANLVNCMSIANTKPIN